MKHISSAQEDCPFALNQLASLIEGVVDALVRGRNPVIDAMLILSENIDGAIRLSAVDDDVLKVPVTLAENAKQGRFQSFSTIENDCDQGEEWRVGMAGH